MNRLQLLLGRVAEECAEVAQIALKAQQFGLEERHRDQPYTNAERINLEMQDLLTVVFLLNKEYNLGFEPDEEHMARKIEKINKYVEYSKQLGKDVWRAKVMSEIKTPVEQLVEGKTYSAEAEDWLITEKHTLSDIARWLAKNEGDAEEIMYILQYEHKILPHR